MLCKKCGSQFSDALPVCPNCGEHFGVAHGILMQQGEGGSFAGSDSLQSKNLVPQTPTPEPGRPLPKQFPKFEPVEEKPKVYATEKTITPKPAVKPAEPELPKELPKPVELPKKQTVPFVPPKKNYLLGIIIGAIILFFFLGGGVWALDELAPGFLPFRLYDFVAGNQKITDFLPDQTAGLLALKVGGDSKQIEKISKNLAKLPGGQSVEGGIADFLRAKEIEEYLGISFKNDIQPALGSEIYFALFSFKTGPENDLVFALQLKDETKLMAALSKIQQKESTKIVQQEKFGVKYWIVDLTQGGRTGQIIGKTYQFKIGDFWFVTTNEHNLIEILRVRNNQKISKMFFGGMPRLSTNLLYKKSWDFYGLQDWLAFAFLSGEKLLEANIPQFGGLDRMIELPTKNSALSVSLSAEDAGLRFSYRYFSKESKDLNGPKLFEPEAQLAKLFPQKFQNGPVVFYYEAASLSNEIKNLEKTLGKSKDFYKDLNEKLGIDVEAELLDQFTGGWAGIASVPENRVNPEVGIIAQISDAEKMNALLEKIKANSKYRWRKTKNNGIIIYYTKPPEFEGWSLALAAREDKLYLASSIKGVKELLNFPSSGQDSLANEATFKSQYQKTERKIHSGFYVLPSGLYALIKLYFGANLSTDADLVLAAYAKALSAFNLVNFSEKDRAGADSFLTIGEIPAEEKAKAEEALSRILVGVSPPPTETPTPTQTPQATATETQTATATATAPPTP
jgi:hypothetical protein